LNHTKPSPQSLRDRLINDATSTRPRALLIFLAIAVTCLSLSQLSSWLVNSSLSIGSSVAVVDGVFNVTHVRNLGGVFGMAQGKGWLFALFSIALISVLCWYLVKGKQVRQYEFIFFGFVAGGGISNILDRLIYGSVVDFIDIRAIPFWNYVFNTADVFIHVGLWPLLFIGLFWHRD